ncbi:ead/Ea22-like family protein [Klebsiella quasipneumoniae]|nr:hypothetical protein [Klebsiella quasipneumoniae]MEB6528075.1 ead/Ea22-like family protein [Klebsiella quasipneumoniae]
MTDITELARRVEHIISDMKLKHGDKDTYAPVMKWDEFLALVEALEKAQTINAAAEKLVRCKGRYHSEQNYRALAALFGVKTPDLPPLEHENVHYADAAEMEIAALRQRIAELESRAVKLPPCVDDLHGIGMVMSADAVVEALASAGIKVEVE